MEQFAPLIGTVIAAIITLVVWFFVDHSDRARKEKEARERLEAQMASFNAQAQNAAQWATGFTGYGYTGYGPSSTLQDPYGLSSKPKDDNSGLRDGLKKLL